MCSLVSHIKSLKPGGKVGLCVKENLHDTLQFCGNISLSRLYELCLRVGDYC